ncbi:hypothetical protein H0E87_018083 [Populus deltoides]|uniref:RING-type domain-containing protein n=1 Tax=Populus deltoides TaxID=3696 RepID=A0A8T2Y2V6_POPDE|nr:hypothetical protein H0E87_018083 [Populus deltoides]
MGSKWRKAKSALGLNMCLYVPPTDVEQRDSSSSPSPARLFSRSSHGSTTPTPSSSGLRLSTSPDSNNKRTCAICLTAMKTGQGQAIFMAECSHSFHFHCIASNVKHGNQICPVCRAKWKEIPFQRSVSDVTSAESQE